MVELACGDNDFDMSPLTLNLSREYYAYNANCDSFGDYRGMELVLSVPPSLAGNSVTIEVTYSDPVQSIILLYLQGPETLDHCFPDHCQFEAEDLIIINPITADGRIVMEFSPGYPPFNFTVNLAVAEPSS